MQKEPIENNGKQRGTEAITKKDEILVDDKTVLFHFLHKKAKHKTCHDTKNLNLGNQIQPLLMIF